MQTAISDSPEVLNKLPKPGDVRRTLGERLREVRLLRRLLRIAEDAERHVGQEAARAN